MIPRESDTLIHRSDPKEQRQPNYHSASKGHRLDGEKEGVPEVEEMGDFYKQGKEDLVLKAEQCPHWN